MHSKGRKWSSESHYELAPAWVDVARMKRERSEARRLRSTSWWKVKIQSGRCGYCDQIFKPDELTMDHVVPLARGGTSTKGNLVAACRACNSNKGLSTPAEKILSELSGS